MHPKGYWCISDIIPPLSQYSLLIDMCLYDKVRYCGMEGGGGVKKHYIVGNNLVEFPKQMFLFNLFLHLSVGLPVESLLKLTLSKWWKK